LVEEGILISKNSSSTCDIEIPEELFRVEQALLMLAKAMQRLEKVDLGKNEILRAPKSTSVQSPSSQ
jgi:hypothetical protein